VPERHPLLAWHISNIAPILLTFSKRFARQRGAEATGPEPRAVKIALIARNLSMADARDLAMIDADADEFDLPALFRLAAWGAGAAAALFLAMLAAMSGVGATRAKIAFTALAGHGPAQHLAEKQPVRPVRPSQAELETRRLAAQMRQLAADRDHLAQRLSALEHNLDDATGSIKRAEAEAAVRTAPAAPPVPASTQPTAQTPASVAAPPPVQAVAAPSPAAARSVPPPADPATVLPRSDRPQGAIEAFPQAKAAETKPAVSQALTHIASPEEPPEAASAQVAATDAAMPLPLPRPEPSAAQEAKTAVAVPAAQRPQPARPPASNALESERAPAHHGFAVDLGGEISITRLHTLWNNLRAGEPKLLRDLRPLASMQSSEQGGRPDFRLVAGPLRSQADAQTLCTAMLSSGRYCRPTSFAGQRLR
jgi:hypothetical protein